MFSDTHTPELFMSVLAALYCNVLTYCSVLFCSVLFCSVLFCSVQDLLYLLYSTYCLDDMLAVPLSHHTAYRTVL